MSKDSDYEHKQRRKGSDKARRNFELNGTYTSKHLRLRAAALEKAAADRCASTETKKEGDGPSLNARRHKR